MRFWLSLILGTILISFSMTWLMMHQGKEVLAETPRLKPAAKEEPPAIAFELKDKQRAEANVVEVSLPDSPVGELREAKIAFVNQGKGALRLEYMRESCGCQEMRIDGKKFGPNSVVLKKPGEKGEIIMTWRAEKKHLDGQEDKPFYRFSADVKSNDPAFNAPLRFEVLTKIVPERQGAR